MENLLRGMEFALVIILIGGIAVTPLVILINLISNSEISPWWSIGALFYFLFIVGLGCAVAEDKL